MGLKSLPRCEKLNVSMFWQSFSMQLSERWIDSKCIILLKPLINCLLYFKFPNFLLSWFSTKDRELSQCGLTTEAKFKKKNNKITKLTKPHALSYINVANYIFQRLRELFALIIYDYRTTKIKYIAKLSLWYRSLAKAN